jgi:peptidoglycan/xylan/chitin deacetylase (PgdA/CDA1 family)
VPTAVLVRNAFHSLGGMRTVRWMRRGKASVVMYHGFSSDHAPLERHCNYLRKYYNVVSVACLSMLLSSGKPLPEWTVAITVDDGHRNFYEHAFPVFAKYQIPSTIYLVTKPIDERGWLWFDRVSYAVSHSQRHAVELPLFPGENRSQTTELGGEEQRSRIASELIEKLKNIPNTAMRRFVSDLEYALNVELPTAPPSEYGLVTWDDVRAMARDSRVEVEFGAHTVTHPILSQLDSAAGEEEEIREAKNRIEAELERPAAHFAYPNGRPEDISKRIVDAVRRAGYETAMTTSSGQICRGDDPFLLKRISCDAVMPEWQFRQRVAAFRVRA